MAFLTIEDETCLLDSVIIFPKVKQKYKYILYEGNNLIFCGSVSGNDTSFIVDPTKVNEDGGNGESTTDSNISGGSGSSGGASSG